MEIFKFNSKKIANLFTAVLSLKDLKDVEAFFRDLCTIDELKAMTERWEIAQLVDRGLSYREVADKLRVSTTTVSRVAFWLNHGEGGYRAVLDKLKNKNVSGS